MKTSVQPRKSTCIHIEARTRRWTRTNVPGTEGAVGAALDGSLGAGFDGAGGGDEVPVDGDEEEALLATGSASVFVSVPLLVLLSLVAAEVVGGGGGADCGIGGGGGDDDGGMDDVVCDGKEAGKAGGPGSFGAAREGARITGEEYDSTGKTDAESKRPLLFMPLPNGPPIPMPIRMPKLRSMPPPNNRPIRAWVEEEAEAGLLICCLYVKTSRSSISALACAGE